VQQATGGWPQAVYQLILWRIFHFWWRFLLPILRLRLGFAILFSVNRLRTLLQNSPVYYTERLIL
jgi:hypothetical protein